MKSTLLIVDDDEEIRTQMKWALTNDYEVVFADEPCCGPGSFPSGQAGGHLARSRVTTAAE